MNCKDCEYEEDCFWFLKALNRLNEGYCNQSRKKTVKAPRTKEKVSEVTDAMK